MLINLCAGHMPTVQYELCLYYLLMTVIDILPSNTRHLPELYVYVSPDYINYVIRAVLCVDYAHSLHLCRLYHSLLLFVGYIHSLLLYAQAMPMACFSLCRLYP